MQERPRDTNDLAAIDEMGRVGELVVERPSAQRPMGLGKQDPTPPQDSSVEQPTAYQSEESSSDVENTEGTQSGGVMGSLNVRELEMVRKLDEISKLEEIAVGGTTNIQAEVIAAIAGIAVQSVEGVASLGETSLGRNIRERAAGSERRARGVAVEVGRREVIVDLNLRVIYGYSIPTIVVKVREAVADRLVNLCGLLAKEINVKVTGIEFPTRMPGRVQ
jgi:uncharacterized alkaline shock family protein YloU